MSKKIFRISGCVILPFILFAIACKNPTSPVTNEVVSVSVSPASIELEPGGEKQFAASVTVKGTAAKTVTWSVSGKSSGSTTDISSGGLLTVGLNETAESLTVTATSTVNKAKKGTATVTVSEQQGGGTVTLSIKTPLSIRSAQGGTLRFEADVDASEGASDEINWTVGGNSANTTTIAKDPSDKHAAVLSIAQGETATALTITAHSVADTSATDSIQITVLHDVKIVGVSEGADPWALPGTAMQTPAAKNGTFTYAATISGKMTFRFNLNNATTYTSGEWFGPVDTTEIDVHLGSNAVHFFSGDETRAWALPSAGTYRITLNPGTLLMTVSKDGVDPLPAPAAPALSNHGEATWNGLSDETKVTGYTVQLFKGGAVVATESVNKGQTYSKDFLSVMQANGLGAYTVKVTANGNNNDSADSDPSPASEPQNVTQRPAATTLQWNGDTATWSAGVGDSTSLGYLVKLYKDNAYVSGKDYTGTVLSHNFANDIADNGSYTFTVTALGDNYLVLGAAESAKSGANVKQNEIWLVGTMSNNWALPGTVMTKSGETFTWEGDAEADDTFRFSLTDTTAWDDKWNGNWYAPEENNSVVTDNTEYVIKPFGTRDNPPPLNPDLSATDNAWKISVTGYYKLILKPAEMKLRVERPVTVTRVTITEKPTVLFKGGTYPFAAEIEGTNTDGVQVTWTVSSAGKHTDTKFAGSMLTVSPNESLTSLTIKAAVGSVESAPVTIDVQVAAKAAIKITVQDKGSGLTISNAPSTPPTMYKIGSPGSLEFEVANPDQDYTYTWYVDADATGVTGTSIPLDAANYGVGNHTVRLTVKIGSVTWSLPDILRFTVAVQK